VRLINHLIAPDEDGFDFAEPSWRTSCVARRADRPSGRRRQAILEEAVSRDIPYIRLNSGSSLVQLGQGVHAQRIRATMTSQAPVRWPSTSPATRT
jgi:cyanophycin synthetase